MSKLSKIFYVALGATVLTGTYMINKADYPVYKNQIKEKNMGKDLFTLSAKTIEVQDTIAKDTVKLLKKHL